MTTTPATRIRRARTTARAIARAAARHGLPSQCARNLANLAATLSARDTGSLPYCHVLRLVEACVCYPTVRDFMGRAA